MKKIFIFLAVLCLYNTFAQTTLDQQLVNVSKSSVTSGIINITWIDFQNKVMSGTFNAILSNKDNPSEKIQVTEGRFDIKF